MSHLRLEVPKLLQCNGWEIVPLPQNVYNNVFQVEYYLVCSRKGDTNTPRKGGGRKERNQTSWKGDKEFTGKSYPIWYAMQVYARWGGI